MTDPDHTDVESLVARSLGERANRLDGVDGAAGMGGVLDRAQVRRRRRRQVVAMGTVVCVTALGAGVLSLLPDDPDGTIAGGTTSSEPDADADDESAPVATAFATVPTTVAPSATTTDEASADDASTATTTVPAGPQFSDEEQIYTIVAGDSVFRIASIHGIEADELAEYNEWPDGVRHLLVPGETVRIPPDSQIPASATTVPGGGDPAATDPSTSCVYTIVAGDNPSKVADRFGISVQDLQEANAESVMASFLVGAQLVIPGVADCG